MLLQRIAARPGQSVGCGYRHAAMFGGKLNDHLQQLGQRRQHHHFPFDLICQAANLFDQ
ncbi:hypothetical protein [Curvibacter fontanus]